MVTAFIAERDCSRRDHTSQSFTDEYSSSMGIYRIPILFYAPGYIKPKREERIVQQTDIFPSLIDFLNYDTEVLAFGNSFFDQESDGFSITYLNNIYQLIQGDYCLQFDGKETIAFHNWKQDPDLQNNLIHSDLINAQELEKITKAIIQQYNNRLIENNLIP